MALRPSRRPGRASTPKSPPPPPFWQVLDADGFEAFTEAGSCFDSETAARARKYIYSSGNGMEPGSAYRLFRGRDPAIEPMLRKKGMMTAAQV